MVSEARDPNGRQESHPSEEWELLSGASKQGEGFSFPAELTAEPEPEIKTEHRQTLYQQVMRMTVPQKMRLARMGNREARTLLIHDLNQIVAISVLKSPKVTENEIWNLAQQKTLPEEALLFIAQHKTWMKNYPIKVALTGNPKVPLATAIRLLDHLHDKDLQVLSRNKNVSSVLARAAAKLLIKRKG